MEYRTNGERINVNDKRFSASLEITDWVQDKSRLIYIGKLLGRARSNFQPSSTLLKELAALPGVRRLWVDERVGWLFACGRDVFTESILRTEGSFKEGATFLLMLENDCLGYGRVESREGQTILVNLFDLGDFLRRENRSQRRRER